MGAEIDEFYVLLRAQTEPMVQGFLTTGEAGERMAEVITAATDAIDVALKKMATDATETGEQIAAGLTPAEAAIKRMAESVQATSLEMEASWDADRYAIDKLAKATIQASIEMEAAQRKAAVASEEMAAKIDASAVTTKSRLAGAAGGFAMVGLAVGAAAVESIHLAGNFEQSTQKIVSSGGEIQSNINDVRKGLLNMAGEVGYTGNQLSDAFYKASSAGFNFAHGGLAVVRAASEGAKAEQADLTLVTDAVTSAMVDYHYKADQAATVTSKLVAATSAGKTTFQELSGSLSQILPVASAAHVSLDDILGDLASMTVHGMSAQQASQNLADVIRHMQNPTAIQAKEFALLGMTTNDVQEALSEKGLSGTLNMITDRIKNFMPPGSQKVIMDLGNALKGLPAPVQDLAGKLIDGSISMKEYSKAALELDPVSAKQAQSFATLAGSTHRIGDQMIDGKTVLQNYGSALAKATGDSVGLRTALMLTGENADTTKRAIDTVSGAATEAGNHVRGWHEIQKTFNQRWSEFKAGLQAVFIQMGEKLLPIASEFLGWLMNAAKWLKEHKDVLIFIASIIGGALVVALAMATAAAIDFAVALLMNPITWIVLAIGALIFLLVELVMHWKTVWKFIKDVSADVGHFFVSVWNDIVKIAKDIWEVQIVKPIKTAAHAISVAIDAVVDFFKKLPGRVLHALEEMPHAVATNTRKTLEQMAYLVGFGIGKIYKFFHDLPGEIEKLVRATWDKAVTATTEGIVAVVDWFHKLPGRAHELWESVKDKTIEGITNVLVWVMQLPGKVEHWFIETRDKAVRAATDLVNSVINWLYQLPGRAWDALTSLYHTVVNFFSGAGDWLYNAGLDLLKGLVNGLKAGWNWAVDTVKGIGHSMVQGFKDAVGIHSPSKLFEEAGGHVVAGLVVGIRGAMSQAEKAVGDLASLVSAPALSITGSVALSAAGGAPMPGGPSPLAGPSPLLAPSGGGGATQIALQNEIRVFLDGDELRNVTIRDAQRNKLRNGRTLLT